MDVSWGHLKESGHAVRADISAHLAKVPIFAGLSDSQREYLLDQMQARIYAPGERVFVQGSKGNEVHVVLEGTVSLLALRKDGREALVSRLSRGQSFGEIGFLIGQPRSLSAVNGPEPGLHLVLSRFDFDRMTALLPDIGLGVFERVLELITERMTALPAPERNRLMWGYDPPVPRGDGLRAAGVTLGAGAAAAVVAGLVLADAWVALVAGLVVATMVFFREGDEASGSIV